MYAVTHLFCGANHTLFNYPKMRTYSPTAFDERNSFLALKHPVTALCMCLCCMYVGSHITITQLHMPEMQQTLMHKVMTRHIEAKTFLICQTIIDKDSHNTTMDTSATVDIDGCWLYPKNRKIGQSLKKTGKFLRGSFWMHFVHRP